MTRTQLYLDVSMSSGGGGRKPDGTPTPFVDMDYVLNALKDRYAGRLVLDPHPESRWTIQCALRDAFGFDGTKDPEPHRLQRLRDLAATMTFIPEWMVHKAVVLDHHDRCPMPHGED